MSKYQEFKVKYDIIPKHPKAWEPEPWLDYPDLIEDMLKTIKELEESKNTIYEEIKQERQRQDDKFGTQPRNLKPEVYLAILTEEIGEVARAIIEGDSENYREELIQIAAVCTAAVEEFDNGNSLNEITSVCKPIRYRKDNEQNS